MSLRKLGLCALAERASLRDVNHQVIVPIQGIIPAASIAEHLPRDGAQDRGRGHFLGGQWGQGSLHPSSRPPAWESQRASHGAVRRPHSHLQWGRNTGRAAQGDSRASMGWPAPIAGGWADSPRSSRYSRAVHARIGACLPHFSPLRVSSNWGFRQ